ncbi:MAG: DNA translocase FtsK [Candidatus Paceibacterota bacterium]
MAKKKESDIAEKVKFWNEIKTETTQAVLAIFSFLLAVLSLMAAFGKAGRLGDYLFIELSLLFGVGYYLIPAILIMLSIAFIRGIKKKLEISKVISLLIFFVSGLGLIHMTSTGAGGAAGRWISTPFIYIMDIWATTVLLIALVIVSLFIVFEAHFTMEQLAFWRWFQKDEEEGIEEDEKKSQVKNVEIDEEETENVNNAIAALDKNKIEKIKPKSLDLPDEYGAFAPAVQMPLSRPFNPPPLTLLEKDKGKPETGDIKANANIIKRTLQNFGITVEMDEISIGPTVTRYALKPAEGVKLSRILALNNDLALALAAHPIRIEAPIPGKSLVGIEVPNTAKTTVGLATLLASADYQDSEKPLYTSLGKDITGRAHFCNLGKAPHMLIAGTTGSGKSVTIHAIITSLLFRNSPENLKFIMIDPKRVELTLYNKIPHLLTPVITDPKKAILSLKWAAKEMSRRYDVLEKNSARDIDSYHRNILAPALEKSKKDRKSKGEDAGEKLPETMPFIVIVIDELADIMQSYPRELESAIVRLAQMSRATGIHLILSTQRPSVNVITGLIKANIPTRVALQVASQIDSRTILDQPGAEKLLGAGDMLYLGGEMAKPVRLQSAFIGEAEVKGVAKYLKDEYRDEIINEINLTPGEPGSDAAYKAGAGSIDLDSVSLEEEDEMYEDARATVMEAGKASTSYIQRKLGVGYSRAAKLMDTLEQRGVIGPANGSKPRDVIGSSQSETNIPDTGIDLPGTNFPSGL